MPFSVVTIQTVTELDNNGMQDHAVQRLDGVSRVDNLADICRVGKERGQVRPVSLPAATYLRITAVPGIGERFQRLQAWLSGHG